MKQLRQFTSARVALGSSGGSLPTDPLLDLRLAHARARDAVHMPLDLHSITQEVAAENWRQEQIHSMARDRAEYLQRPDLGRRLDEDSRALLGAARPEKIVFVVADGLSALAVHRHAIPLLREVFARLEDVRPARSPIHIATQARVALADEVGELLGAELSIILIGERPGLSTPDSLGVYLTWNPRIGKTDAERNCVSNIHEFGLSYELAAEKLCFLIRESLQRKLSGVALKETSAEARRISSS